MLRKSDLVLKDATDFYLLLSHLRRINPLQWMLCPRIRNQERHVLVVGRSDTFLQSVPRGRRNNSALKSARVGSRISPVSYCSRHKFAWQEEEKVGTWSWGTWLWGTWWTRCSLQRTWLRCGIVPQIGREPRMSVGCQILQVQQDLQMRRQLAKNRGNINFTLFYSSRTVENQTMVLLWLLTALKFCVDR